MKKNLSLVIFIFIQLLFIHTVTSQTYVWTQKANFTGGARYFPAGFSIGNKGYVGTGKENGVYLNDFWEYDQSIDVWTQKASMPDSGRIGAVGFALGGKGYITTGWWTSYQLTDLWQYDPLTNNWSQKTNFGGAGRYTATSFATDSFAYVGCGYSPYQNDFWKYDPSLDAWTQIANVGGLPRTAPAAFAIGNQGYVVGGGVQFGAFVKELWNFDEASNTWTQKADLPADGRYGSVGFAFNGKGFAGIGQTDLIAYQDFYQYNPTADQWTQVNDFGGGLRQGCVAFSIGDIGYCGLGSSTLFPNLIDHQDWWSFQEVNDHNLIVGNLYVDSNNNQLVDIGEAPVKNVIVQVLPGPTYVSSNNTGIYAAIADTGSLDVTLPNPPLYYTYNPSLINVVFPQVNQIDSGNNFAFYPAGLINDLRVSLTPMGIVRANNPDWMNVTYKNIGTTVMSGTIELQLDTNLSYVTTEPYDSSIVQNGNLLTWSYAILQPGESRAFIVKCLISNNVFLNDTIRMSATIYPVAGDTVPGDNTDNQQQIVIGSYDPNDKTVNIEKLDIQNSANWGWLEYIIRFQNTGNAPAIDIVVKDSLGSFYDVPSFEMLATSFPAYFQMNGSGNITWTFKNIWLPDSTSNEPGSHGFIRFRIKPKNNLMLGNVIENFAAIYFDNNPPVITNTAKTTIVTSSGVNGTLADGSNSISVFPNPNDGKFILSFTSGISCKGKLEIINTKGQVVVSKVMDIRSGINHSAISEKLAQGIYLIKVKFADQSYYTKYLVE